MSGSRRVVANKPTGSAQRKQVQDPLVDERLGLIRRIEALQSVQGFLLERVQEEEAKLREAKNALAESERTLADKEAELESLRARVDELVHTKGELADKREQLSELQIAMGAVAESNVRLSKEHAELRETIKRQSSEIEELKARLEKLGTLGRIKGFDALLEVLAHEPFILGSDKVYDHRPDLFTLNSLLSNVDSLIADGRIAEAVKLLTPKEVPHSGWHFRADFGAERQSIFPIFGYVIVGRYKPKSDTQVEVTTDMTVLRSYFDSLRSYYSSSPERLRLLSEMERDGIFDRITCGIFFAGNGEGANSVSRLHGLIEVRHGIRKSDLYLHSLGLNGITIGDVLHKPPAHPFLDPIRLATSDQLHLGNNFSVKVYQSSSVIHTLLICCDNTKRYSDHFQSEIYGVQSQFARISRLGTTQELIGDQATRSNLLERLAEYQSLGLPEDATLVVAFNLHGSASSLCLMGKDISKEQLLAELAKIPCKKVLLVNACHAGGFWDRLERIPDNTLIVSSSRSDELTYGGSFLRMAAKAIAEGKDLKNLDGVKVHSEWSQHNHEAQAGGMTQMVG